MVTIEERFSVQIEENKKGGHTTLYGFLPINGEQKLIDLTIEDFNTVYEIDREKDIHKCIVPILKKIK